MMRIKPFFTGYIVSLALIVGIITVANFTIDISGVYHDNAEFSQLYARKLMETPSGLVKPPGSERKIKSELIKLKAADCYVTGSSHEMEINLGSMPALRKYCTSVLNLAVSGGSYEDALITFDQLSDHRNSLIIIGIAPWFFKRGADIQWQELGSAYQDAHSHFLGSHISNDDAVTEKLKNLTNGMYFLRNIQSLRTTRPSRSVIEAIPTQLTENDAILLQDGSLRYSRTYIESTLPRRETVDCSEYKIYPPFVDPVVVAEMHSVINRMKSSGLKIAMLLMPYHPAALKCANNTIAAMNATDSAARSIGKDLNVPVLGNFNPSFDHLTAADFYDFMHMDINSLDKIHLDP